MIDAAMLKHLLHYDQESGVFRWKNPASNSVRRGSKAGCLNDEGYICIKIGGVSYRAHRLAWVYMTNSMPEHGIDHKDRNRANNAWENLRDADHPQNCWNRQSSIGNKCGFKGVSKTGSGRFAAVIKVRKRRIHLGVFDSAAAAYAAYQSAVSTHHGRFAAEEGKLT